MQDYIAIERIWQDTDFFEIKLTCVSDIITAIAKVYTSNESIDDLSDKIKSFINGNVKECFWENGERGDGTTACVSMKFFQGDELGHIKIEVFMELDDGGKFSKHNCCFYVNTELGLLTEFQKDLSKIKSQQLGEKVVLNQI